MNKLRAFLAFAAASIAAGSSSLLAAAAPREIEITANDQMKFNLAKIEAKVGETIKVVLMFRPRQRANWWMQGQCLFCRYL